MSHEHDFAFQLDHILHTVHHPDEARRDFATTFGWHGIAGGQHLHWGTHNALAYFGLSYFEWIGVRDEEVARDSDFGSVVHRALQLGEGAVQFALRTHDIEGVAKEWARHSVEHHGPVPGERTLPNGTTIRWKLLFPSQSGDGGFLLPFVIEWEDDDSVRLARFAAQGSLQPPPLDKLRIHTLHVATHRPELAVARSQRYYPATPVNVRADGFGEGIAVAIGLAQTVIFWDVEDATLQQNLAQFGERIFQVDLAATPTASADSTYILSHRVYHGLSIHVVD